MIVTAGAVVTKDAEDNTVVGSNPTVIKHLYREIIEYNQHKTEGEMKLASLPLQGVCDRFFQVLTPFFLL